MKKIFSVPLNPKLTESEYNQFLDFLEKYKHLIYDVYFTSRIPPFNQDAMGDVFLLQEDGINAIRAALHIQQTLKIPVSATFNNTLVRPDQKNLDIFITNFKPLYDAGIRIATIPHTHWMATGQIKKAFPELYVKNTILRDVRTATEIINLAKVGFDYINLDRDLMRDRDTLLRLKEAKAWIKNNLEKDIKFSLLANEGCVGNCPMMVEHFEFNNSRVGDSPQYFNDAISRVSCPKWDHQDPAITLKTADLPPWKEDWQEFLDNLGIDVFKMHGREAPSRLFETMKIIENWDQNKEILIDNFLPYIQDSNLIEKPIDIWREKIKNCKFDCWECQYCDKIYKAKSPYQFSDLVKHTAESVKESGIPSVWIDIPGLTSPRAQTLLNLLAKGVGTYLEIGSYLGATVSAVLKDNTITAYCIDSWKQDLVSQDGSRVLPINSKDDFYHNIKPYEGTSLVKVIDKDMFDVSLNEIENPIQLFFYDGPHEKEITASVLEYYFPVLANECILVFDDANWGEIVDAVDEKLKELKVEITYQKLMLNDIEDKNAWWNGMYILVIRK
jgi:predicted O-methyltransferase YrrM